MKIKIRILSLLIISMLLTGCGYKRIHSVNENLIQISSVEVSGDSRLANIIKNRLNLISSINGKNIIDLKLDLSKEKQINEKDITGKIKKYDGKIIIKMSLKDLNSSNEFKQSFEKKTTYSVGNTHSSTILNEKRAMRNIAINISEDIGYFLNIYYKNK